MCHLFECLNCGEVRELNEYESRQGGTLYENGVPQGFVCAACTDKLLAEGMPEVTPQNAQA